MVLLYIIITVYIAAVNFYAVMLVKAQRDEYGDTGEKPTGDGKLILCAMLGGAVAVYVCMFLMRYRLKNMLFMILMPVIGVLNVYFFFLAYRSGLSIFVINASAFGRLPVAIPYL